MPTPVQPERRRRGWGATALVAALFSLVMTLAAPGGADAQSTAPGEGPSATAPSSPEAGTATRSTPTTGSGVVFGVSVMVILGLALAAFVVARKKRLAALDIE